MRVPILNTLTNTPLQNGNHVKCSYFLELPTEVIQHIAVLLPSDKDLCSLIGTCSTLAAILIPPSSGVWRQRFRTLYDPPHDRTSVEIKIEYQIRSLVLNKSVGFRSGEGAKQSLWLEIIKTMLIESFIRPNRSRDSVIPASKNLDLLAGILSGSEFMNRPVVGYERGYLGKPTDSFAAVQLCLTHLAINLETGYRSLRTDYDISVVYKYGLPNSRIFRANEVCLESLLHIRNFWKRHITSPDEDTFYMPFMLLSPGRRPSPWSPQSTEKSDLGMHWLGFYSCIHPFPESLSALEERQTCADLDTHWNVPRILSLELATRRDNPSWPELFNSILPIHDNVPEADRKFFHGRQCFDNIRNLSQGFAVGFTEELPAQGGLPGWRRICFVICEINKDSLPPTAGLGQDLPTEEWLFSMGISTAWGYEGMLLPGGRIMLGRWSDMFDLEGIGCDGPFIFWQV